MSTDSSTPADPTRGPAPDTDPSASSSATAAALPAAGSTSTVRGLLDEERGWVRALLILSTFAVLFVVLGFLASYFQDYLGIILIFFFAWFIAFLVTPPVDWIERHLPRMPRPMAVILILVPVLAVCGGVVVVVLTSVARSLFDLAQSLVANGGRSPTWIADLQAFLDQHGINVDVAGTFHTIAPGALKALADFALGSVGGVAASFSMLMNVIVVISLAVFMAIDRDRALGFGMELVPPAHRGELALFRKSVSRAFTGFIRSQLALGAIYGLWAFAVSVVLGLPSAVAAGFLSGAIMAIPIFGPYVSWLPPVVIAAVFMPDVAIVCAILMLVGWFIDENILAPIVRAGAVDLNPMVIMAAFLIGAHLAGAVGALVSIPIAAIISAIFFYWFARRRVQRGEIEAPPGERLADIVPGPPAADAATAAG